MKVYVGNQNQALTLTQNNYLAAGGEGTIYVKDRIAYKIYQDPKKMIPTAKIQELSVIRDNHVIKPEDIIYDPSRQPIGYSMPYLSNTTALCQIFPRSFRERNNIDHHQIFDLVKQFQDTIQNIHKTGILIVDLNEMNFLLNQSFGDILFIDVDSYQTKSFPATALMPSIRDWKTPLNHFTENSDWFSFGVVSFQMFTGIHPFKGKHPKINDMEERMKAGVSVLDKQVKVPPVVYSFSVIPKEYYSWYENLFVNQKRCPPPNVFTKLMILVSTQLNASTSSGGLEFVKLGEYDSNILYVLITPFGKYVITDFSIYKDNHIIAPYDKQYSGITFSSKSNIPIAYIKSKDNFKFINLHNRKEVTLNITYSQFTTYKNRIFLQIGEKVYEILINEIGENIVPTLKEISNVLEFGTKLIGGFFVQSLLGTTTIVVSPKQDLSYQIRIPELNDYQIIEGKFDTSVINLTGFNNKNKQYDKIVIRFNDDFSKYDLMIKNNISLGTINLTVLPNKLMISQVDEDNLQIKSTQLGVDKFKAVDISGNNLNLTSEGMIVLTYQNKELFQIKAK